jgi:hypothetical protein
VAAYFNPMARLGLKNSIIFATEWQLTSTQWQRLGLKEQPETSVLKGQLKK